MVCVELPPQTPEDVLPTLSPVSVYYPLVHTLLRPVLTRAVMGADPDCIEFIVAANMPQFTVAMVKDGKCSCCREAGTYCLTAANNEYVIRCVQCVLNHKFCDLPSRVLVPICVCDWHVPAEDRAALIMRARLLVIQGKQYGLPKKDRLPDDVLDTLKARLSLLNSWMLVNANAGYQMDLRLLEPAMQALGVQTLERKDGKWIVPFPRDWYQCPCYPYHVCTDRHYRLNPETAGEMMDKLNGHLQQERAPINRQAERTRTPSVIDEELDLVQSQTPSPNIVPERTNYKNKGSISRKNKGRKGRA